MASLATSELGEVAFRVLELPATAVELHEQFGRVLRSAILDEALVNGVYDVGQLLRLTVAGRSGDPNVFALTGGPKDFGRTASPQHVSHFIRDDGAVIHFSLAVRERPGAPLDLVANEDLQLPSPLLSPLDALNFLIYRCRPRRDTPRS